MCSSLNCPLWEIVRLLIFLNSGKKKSFCTSETFVVALNRRENQEASWFPNLPPSGSGLYSAAPQIFSDPDSLSLSPPAYRGSLLTARISSLPRALKVNADQSVLRSQRPSRQTAFVVTRSGPMPGALPPGGFASSKESDCFGAKCGWWTVETRRRVSCWYRHANLWLAIFNDIFRTASENVFIAGGGGGGGEQVSRAKERQTKGWI